MKGKRQKARQSKSSIRPKSNSGTSVVGATNQQLTAPSSVGPAQNMLRSTLTMRGRKRNSEGQEIVTYDFHQLLSKVANNTADELIFPGSATYNSNTPGIACSPYFFGGALAQVSAPFRRYKFTKLGFVYHPATSTASDNGIVLAYNPQHDLSRIVPTGAGAGFTEGTGFFDSLLQLAAGASGPMWGPLVIAVGGALKSGAPALAEGMLKWFSNRKPSSSIDAVLAEAFRTTKVQANAHGWEDFNAWAIAAKAAVPALPAFTFTDGETIEIVSTTQQIRWISDAIRRARADTLSENLQTVQGMFMGCASNFLTGTGTRLNRGFVTVEGTIELMDPYGDMGSLGYDDDSNLINNYGDPLDVTDLANAPLHKYSSAGERTLYLFRTWSHTPYAMQVCDHIEKLTGHRLHDQSIHAVTTLEIHAEQLVKHEILSKRELQFRSRLELAAPSTSKGCEEVIRPSSDKDDGVIVPRLSREPTVSVQEVSRMADVMKSMRALVAGNN